MVKTIYFMEKFLFIILASSLLFNNFCSTQPDDENDHNGPIAKGCSDIEYPDWKTSPYVLPYPVGKSYKIDLSNCSGSYHSEGKPDQFAIDFNMEIGTLITAAREGKVVLAIESGKDVGGSNNLVIIKHDDNTFAQYMHLTKNGALVEIGDIIKQGDEIGLSGNTGLAGYPHLHFVVTKDWKWTYVSIPITFRNTISNERGLASGIIYQALEY